jgi:hypothetical protein
VTIVSNGRAIVTVQEEEEQEEEEEELRLLHLSAMKRNGSCTGGERRKYVSRRFYVPTDD